MAKTTVKPGQPIPKSGQYKTPSNMTTPDSSITAYITELDKRYRTGNDEAREKCNVGNDPDDWNIKRTRYDLISDSEKHQHSGFKKVVKIHYRLFDMNLRPYYTKGDVIPQPISAFPG
jgi:hypothetical protein